MSSGFSTTMTDVASSVQVPLDTIPISPDGTNGEGSHDSSGDYDDGTPITVFHDNANFNVKHPLMNKWTLWFTKPPTGKVSTQHDPHTCCTIHLIDNSQNDNWNELLKQVISFDSVEEFWGIYVSSF
jgi:translation initiation factor 4E